MSRNPLIFGLFTRMHLVERVASRVPRMREAMKEANLPEPIFRTEGMFTVVFERPKKLIENIEGVNEGVNEGLSAPELTKILGKSLATTERYLSKFRKAGLIEFRGAPKTGGYYVIK